MTFDAESSIYKELALLVRRCSRTALAKLAETETEHERSAWERVEFSADQGGTQPREVDRFMSEVWRKALAANDAGINLHVFGEEIDERDLSSVPDGSYIAVVDPIDGTTNWVTVGIGSAMSIVLYRRLGGELIYIGVSVVQINWRRHWWAEPLSTWRGMVDGDINSDELVLSPHPGNYRDEDDWVVAGVGSSKGETRDFLNFLTNVSGLRTVTLGGVPLGPEVLDRELTALVECKYTTVFDSAHLMLAANTDAVVGTLDGHVLSAPQLRNIFLRVRLSKDRVVPPYVLAKSREQYGRIVEEYQAMRRSPDV